MFCISSECNFSFFSPEETEIRETSFLRLCSAAGFEENLLGGENFQKCSVLCSLYRCHALRVGDQVACLGNDADHADKHQTGADHTITAPRGLFRPRLNARTQHVELASGIICAHARVQALGLSDSERYNSEGRPPAYYSTGPQCLRSPRSFAYRPTMPNWSDPREILKDAGVSCSSKLHLCPIRHLPLLTIGFFLLPTRLLRIAYVRRRQRYYKRWYW